MRHLRVWGCILGLPGLPGKIYDLLYVTVMLDALDWLYQW